jgi:phage terminase large subunit-like protein
VQAAVRATAEQDGRAVPIWMEQEPGSAGVAVIDHYLRHVLAGWRFKGERSTGSKAERAQPLAAQAEGGAVRLILAANPAVPPGRSFALGVKSETGASGGAEQSHDGIHGWV